jgi:hypothetical protein
MRRDLMAMLVTGLGLAAGSAVGGAPSYRVEFLGAGWSGSGMNELGDACGNFSVDGTAILAGVSVDGRPFEFLPLPPGMQTSRASDINDAGVIVGAVCPNQYVITQPIAAVWRPTAGGYEVEVIGGLPGYPFSHAWAINNTGAIIGGSGHFGWSLTTPVSFDASGPAPLPGGFVASDINDAGVMLSGNLLIDIATGVVEEIPLPPGNWQGFAGAALNNNNDACGYVIGYSGCSTFPMRYRQSSGWEFLGGCATTTSATSINDRGDALLYYYTTASGVNFVDEGYFALGSLVDPSQGEWYIQWGGATAINNDRRILSSARQGASGPIGAVRLSPMDGGCPADLAPPVGVLDLHDINAFLGGFLGHDASADIDGNGIYDLADVQAFIAAFTAGCP